MSVANQKIIKIIKEKCDVNHFYTTINLQALQKAMLELKGQSFKLWIYLAKNQYGYQLELSQKAAAEWGIKKDAYYAGIELLISKNYLIQQKQNSNIYIFSEIPKNFSEKPKEFSEKPKNFSEKPQRNITNITTTVHNITKVRQEELKNLISADGFYNDKWIDGGDSNFYTQSFTDKITLITSRFPQFSNEDATFILNEIIG